MTGRQILGGALAGLAAVAALTACSGVPASSPPQTVRAVGLGGEANPIPGPPRGDDARAFIRSFLAANWAEPTALASAREFLSPDARKTWTPTSKVTYVIADAQVGTLTSKGSVTVFGRALGTLSPDGAYTPSFGEVKFTYTLRSVTGGYRVTSLPPGLVVTEDLFDRFYLPHPIYFFDVAGRYLVPFVRYSALSDQNQLASWLLNQLADLPDPQNAVSPENLPAQTRRITVTLSGAVTRVQIPGSEQLTALARNHLAAQVSQTLAVVTRGAISIVDGRAVVPVGTTRGTVFSASDFTSLLGPAGPAVPSVNYLLNGRVIAENGKALGGAVNNGSYSYESVALARRASTGANGLAVAAVVGTGNRQQLLVGTVQGGVAPTSVPLGSLSRPAWAPGIDEVWVGDGPRIFRVDTSGKTPTVNAVASPSVAGGGRIVALRLSPDGARIALVVSGSHRSGQLYIGSVVRGAGQPQIVNLQPISPDGAVITDVAWSYALRLTAIGYLASSNDGRVFESGVDGAGWNERGLSGLPAAPLSLTATTDGLAWVSADGYVWTQNGTSWISPGPTGQTPGRDPVYQS